MLRGGRYTLLFHSFDPGPSRLTLPHEVGRDLQVLRSTQRFRDHRFTFLANELSEGTDEEAGNELHGPGFGNDAQDVPDVVPGSESVQELARPFHPVADIFDPEELEEQVIEQPGLFVVRWNGGLVHRTRCGAEDTRTT